MSLRPLEPVCRRGRGDVVRVELPAILVRDVERAARLYGVSRSVYLAQRVREAIAKDVVECDQRSASQARYWWDWRSRRERA